MKPLLVVSSLLLGLALLLVLVLRPEKAAPGRADDELALRIDHLQAQLEQLVQRTAALERRESGSSVLERESARPAPAGEGGVAKDEPRTHELAWYLEQYVLSFDSDPEGSEYFRLLVDAYSIELADGICALAIEPGRPLALRSALVRMLGKARLKGDERVIDTLVTILRQQVPEGLGLLCLEVWARIGDERASARLEGLLWQLPGNALRGRALDVLLLQAGERTNGLILRLLASAPDDQAAQGLIQHLNGADLAAALSVFTRAAQMNQPVRLTAALAIGEFGSDPFLQFVEDWLRVETDAQVIEALRGAKERQHSIPGWSAMQATGAPNADPARDDPNAWASAEPDMGPQWLELTYARPERASGVRIHEVNAPGAVSEVSVRDAGGSWRLVWSGVPGAGAPCLIEFPLTSFRVQSVRIVLDTSRVPSWNEIDAVELLGPSGGQWAERASASSTYAQRGSLSSRTQARSGLMRGFELNYPR